MYTYYNNSIKIYLIGGNRMKLQKIFCLTLILLFALSTCSSPEKGMGNMSGSVVYENPDKETPREPIQNVKIVLCEVSEDAGVPEGPVVASMNEDKVENIGILIAEPTAVTDSVGRFMLAKVPVGTYLILFHLFPDELIGVDWQGAVLPEAYFDFQSQKIPASGKPDFWEKGGLAMVQGNWSSQEGFTAVEGSVCSESLGFCFLIRDQKPYPIVKVQPDSTIEVLLTTHFKPKGED